MIIYHNNILTIYLLKNNTPPPQVVKTEEKHKKKQKHIDPLAPKKPANAFFRFCQVQRKDLKSQIKSEDSSNSDLTKILSNQWKELPKEEKQVHLLYILFYHLNY